MMPWPCWSGQNYLAAMESAMALARNEQQQREMFLPNQQKIASKITSPLFDHQSPSSASAHCCSVEQARPSTIPVSSSISDICSKAKEEMMPPGFWRQLADFPPPPQPLPMMTPHQPPFPAPPSNSLLSVSSTPSSAASTPFLSFVTVPPPLPIQPHNQAQSQLLWMADLFRHAASIAGQSANGANIVGGAGFGIGQHSPNSMIGQQHAVKMIGWNGNNNNAIAIDQMNDKQKEKLQKQLSTEIIVQSPTSTLPLPTTTILTAEMQRQRDLLFLHALSPTPPAFRRQPGTQIDPQHHSAPQSPATTSNSSQQQMVICRPQNGLPNEFDASNAFCSSLLAPPELKREVEELAVGEGTELMGNAWTRGEEEEEEDGDQQFARMPKLEPETSEQPPILIMEQQNMDDNDNQQIAKEKPYEECHSPKEDDEMEEEKQQPSADENCSQIAQNVVTPSAAPSILLPPLPPLLLSIRLRRPTANQKAEMRNEEWKERAMEHLDETNSALTFSSGSQFSDSSATTSSGVSSADSASLVDLPPEEEEEEDEVKENKKEEEKKNGGGGMKKRKRRRRAPKLVIVKRKSAVGKCENKNNDGSQKRGRKRRLTQRQNNDIEESEKEEICEEEPKLKRQRASSKGEKRKTGPKLRIDSNWQPEGEGIKRKPVEDAKEERLCFETIRHRNVPEVCIRLGDCVLVNSAEDEDDIFVGRVLAIHYEKEKRALHLNLLWFYTVRQLPIRQPDAKLLDHRELFASKHLDTINADSVQGIAHVLTFAEYCRYRAQLAISHLPVRSQRMHQNRHLHLKSSNYYRKDFLPKMDTPLDMVFYCRGVYSIRTKRINTVKKSKAKHGLRPC